jgi:hypothetical protein
MKTNRFSIAFAAVVLIAPLGAFAQNAPQGTIVGATAPGKGALGESVQLQGKVKSIDKKERVVVVVGPQGNEVVFNLGEDVRNFDQIKVGDLVTLTYAQAVAIELRKVKNTGIRERDESVQTARAEAGQKPAVAIKKTVRMIADVVAVNPLAQTVTLRGAKHTVELAVKDPAQLKDIKVGNQVEALYVDAVALQVLAAK